VNSGNANAATGEVGIQAARACVDALAAQLGCPSEEILVSSTGVIGRPFPVETIKLPFQKLVAALLPTNIEMLARDHDDRYGSEDRHAEVGACASPAWRKRGMIHPTWDHAVIHLTDAEIGYRI